MQNSLQVRHSPPKFPSGKSRSTAMKGWSHQRYHSLDGAHQIANCQRGQGSPTGYEVMTNSVILPRRRALELMARDA